MRTFIFMILIAMVSVISCTPKSTPVTVNNTSEADKLVQGKQIFENSCGKCHDLPEPTAFNSVQWVGIMNVMAPKAKLNDDQHQLVYDYVASVKK